MQSKSLVLLIFTLLSKKSQSSSNITEVIIIEGPKEDAFLSNSSFPIDSNVEQDRRKRGEEVEAKIVGGKPAKKGRFEPFLCSLVIFGRGHTCGCTMITQDVALSAAHCLNIDFLQLYYIEVGKYFKDGSDSRNNNVKRYGIELFVIPGLYNDNNLGDGYDAMLIKLTASHSKKPVILQFSKKNWQNKRFIAAGWGATSRDGSRGTDKLLQVTVDNFKISTCRNLYLASLPTNICTFTQGKTTCFGDSGGPLFKKDKKKRYKHVQVGITSFGSTFCGDGPAGFTDLANNDIKDFLNTWVCGSEGISRGSKNCRNGKLTNVV